MRDLRHDTAMNGVGDQRQGWFVRRMGRRVLIGTLIVPRSAQPWECWREC